MCILWVKLNKHIRYACWLPQLEKNASPWNEWAYSQIRTRIFKDSLNPPRRHIQHKLQSKHPPLAHPRKKVPSPAKSLNPQLQLRRHPQNKQYGSPLSLKLSNLNPERWWWLNRCAYQTPKRRSKFQKHVADQLNIIRRQPS